MKNIILIGYRCTGKTSVGKMLSERLGLPFVDTDDLIIERAGISIREIVEKGGWDLFRMKEREAIMGISSMQDSIFATGGGAFENQKNGEVLKKNGLFIWLTADVKAIMKRMLADQNSGSQRPSLSHNDLETETSLILKKREPAYLELANLTIDTSGKRIEGIVDDILTFLEHLNPTDCTDK